MSTFVNTFKIIIPQSRKTRAIGTLFLIISVAVVAMFFAINTTHAVSGVTLADSDTVGFGLDGRDFSVTWTAGAEPAGYISTTVYIVSNATAGSLTSSNVLTNGCGGSACAPMVNFFNHANNAFSPPPFQMSDSEGNEWSVGTTYKACILVNATAPSLDCSSSATAVVAESGVDVVDINDPMIDHLSASSYVSGSQMIIYASIQDDQTTSADFVAGTAGAEFKMYFDGTTQNAVTDSVNGSLVSGTADVFSFSTATSLSRTMKYYLKARDKAGNVRYFTRDPDVDLAAGTTAGQAAAAAFSVSAVVAGSNSIAGTINNSATGVAIANSAFVYISGHAIAGTTTSTGTYTILNVPSGSYDITAAKAGFIEQSRFETLTANITGINMSLNTGTSAYVDPTTNPGGGNARVVFSNPPEFDNTAPLSGSILIGFNQTLNASTVNDNNATDATDRVYLTTDNGTTKIAGGVTYCATSSSAGCSALRAGDINVIMFVPSSALTANTQYTLVITSAVTSTSGQSVDGNRPGGGHELPFGTGAGATISAENFATSIGASFGTTGEFMPPFVEAVLPAPGIVAPPNTKVLVRFNEPVQATTINTTNVKLLNSSGTAQTITVVLDSERRVAIITPSANLVAGDYSVQVMGAVSNTRGTPMRAAAAFGEAAFNSSFTVAGNADAIAPTIYPMIADDATGIAVNEGCVEFGFNESMNPSTLSSSNVTLKRGSTAVSTSVSYDPGGNSVCVVPSSVLAPNTTYTVTFTTSVTDLAAQPLASATSYSFTTGSADTTAPYITDARCDDYTCTVFFSEPMNAQRATGSDYTASILRNVSENTNWKIESLTPTMTTLNVYAKPVSYDAVDYSATIEGVSGLAAGGTFQITLTNIEDISGNAISDSGRVYAGPVESSAETYGSFGGGGMFGPPQTSMMSSAVGGAIGGMGAGPGGVMDMGTGGGFGNFTATQFAFGEALMAFPFNQTAGQDVNVFQVRIPGEQLTSALRDNDLLVFTFPNGTTLTNAVPDIYSPFYADFNEFGPGIVTFDSAFNADGVNVDSAAREVQVQVAVTGTPGVNDFYTIDLRGITNPRVPKGPDSSGYTLGVKLRRDSGGGYATIANLTSMPYFINESGTNTITVKVYAGTAVSGTAGATGPIFLMGGGPSGPMDKNLTLTNGVTTAADGTAIAGDAGVIYSSLPNGCYFISTEPFVLLGGVDYFGKDFPEPVCVSGGQSVVQNIVLTSAETVGASVPLNVVISGSYTGDMDIFAGGPGRFVKKTISSPTSTATLRIPATGFWHVGIGPAMTKNGGGPNMDTVNFMPPPPLEIDVNVTNATISPGFFTPSGVTFNNSTDTATFTIQTNNKNIPVLVNDGTTPLANVEVFGHQDGFGMPSSCKTGKLGTCTLKVAAYGAYEVGAFMRGLGDTFKQVEIQSGGITVDGATVATVTLSLFKPDYSISGKVLDAATNGQAIAYMPVFASDVNGNFVHGMTEGDGSYTLWVSAGTWTVKAELPPDKSSTCGTFSKTVVITTASKSTQNVTPTAGTCYTLTGTVTIGGSLQANVPVFIEEWDTVNDRPAGGFFRQSATNASGVYSAEVGAGTYRAGVYHPDYGEISGTVAVSADDTELNINSGTLATITFAFTGGTSSMNGFVEVKKSDDKHTRLGKPFNGADSNLTMSVKSGTYNYFADVFGIGKFSGTVVAGSTATIDVSASTLITLSGTVKDSAGTVLADAVVSVDNDALNIHRTARTGTDGTYSLSVKAGTHKISVSRSKYTPGETAPNVVLSMDTANYDFGGASPDQLGMIGSTDTITGTVYQSDGSTTATNGSVWAQSSSGHIISTLINPANGTYTLEVTDDTSWTIKANGPKASTTTLSGAVNTVDATADTGKNITLTAAASKVPLSESKTVDASAAVTFDDTDNSAMKLAANSGVLSSLDVTIELEKSWVAPEDTDFAPLGGESFDLGLIDSNDKAVKNFTGNAELTLEYDPANLPSGVTEAELEVMYYDTKADKYMTCEGGGAIDATNNSITCLIDHATTFIIGYAKSQVTIASSGGTVSSVAVGAPTSVRATSDGSKVNVTWTNGTGVAQTQILRNSGGTTPVSGSAYSVVSATATTFEDTAVTAGQTYKYIIKACNSSNNCALSEEVSVSVATSATSTVTAPAPSSGGGSGATTPTTPATPATPTDTSATPAVSATPATPATSATPTVGDVGETLSSGTFAYNAARVRTLRTEQVLAKSVATHLDTVLPGVFNRLFHLKTATSKSWWYGYVNAYTYGGYTLEEIRQSVRFGGKTVHPSIPASAWRNAQDYKDYINR